MVQYKFYLALVALAVVAAGAWLYFKTPHYANYPLREGPVVAFGDSLVAGVGSTEGKDFVSVLSKRIGEPIENFGVSGDTTQKGLDRIDEVIARHPRIVLLLLGGNDYLQRIDKEHTFANLRQIVAGLQQDGALVVVLGVRGGLLSDNYATGYKQLAHDTDSVYVSNVLAELFGNKQYMFDQVHPNDAGYAIIAERVYKALQPVLK
jgi:lysophospholipase L1-like esterase